MSGESGRGAALEQLPDMASRGSANGRAAVQVRVLVLDRFRRFRLRISRLGIAPAPSPGCIRHIWRVRFARSGLDASVWPGRSTWGN